MHRLYGKSYLKVLEDLESIGLIYKATKKSKQTFKIPFLYRDGLGLSQKFVPN